MKTNIILFCFLFCFLSTKADIVIPWELYNGEDVIIYINGSISNSTTKTALVQKLSSGSPSVITNIAAESLSSAGSTFYYDFYTGSWYSYANIKSGGNIISTSGFYGNGLGISNVNAGGMFVPDEIYGNAEWRYDVDTKSWISTKSITADGSLLTGITPGQIGAQPTNVNLTSISNGDGGAITNVTAKQLYDSAKGGYVFNYSTSHGGQWQTAGSISASHYYGSGSNLTDISTGQIGAQPTNVNLTYLSTNDGSKLNGVTSQSAESLVNSANGFGIRYNEIAGRWESDLTLYAPYFWGSGATLTGITPSQIGAQPTNLILTQLSSSNGASLTGVEAVRVVSGSVQLIVSGTNFVSSGGVIAPRLISSGTILAANGFVLPSYTKSTRPTSLAGTMIFQTDNIPGLRVFDGTNWMRFSETNDN